MRYTAYEINEAGKKLIIGFPEQEQEDAHANLPDYSEQVDDQPEGSHFQIITSSIFGDDYETLYFTINN